MEIIQFLFFLTLCFVGGVLGNKLKLPVGYIIGAMLAVGMAKTFQWLTIETSIVMSFMMQVTLGLMVGLTFLKLSIEQLRKLATSLVVITFSVFILTIGIGLLLSNFDTLSPNVALLSAAPGGMIEMATIAKTLSLHAPVVIMLHLTRVLAVMTIFPLLLQYLHDRQVKKGSGSSETLGHY